MGDSSNTDTTGGGFTDGSGGGLFGNPGTHGGASDYAGWDWHQIEAAILGGAELPPGDTSAQSRAQGISDPQTLIDAGYDFYTVQTTLQMVGQSLIDQANALAGTNGPWKGDAADAFLTAMTTFSNQVQAVATSLAGGPTGADSVPDQLVNNGNYLSWAKSQISSIDSYYANAALRMTPPASVVNGLVMIHEKPELVKMMTNDMRKVLNDLVGDYQVTIDGVHAPPAVNNPTGNPPPISPPPPIPPPPDVPPPPNVPPPPQVPPPASVPPPPQVPPPASVPPPPQVPPPGSLPPPAGVTPPPPTSVPPGSVVPPPPLSNAAVVPPPGSVLPPPASVAPPPGDSSGNGSQVPPASVAPPPGDGSGAGNQLPPPASVAPPPGDSSGAGNQLPPPASVAPPPGTLTGPGGVPLPLPLTNLATNNRPTTNPEGLPDDQLSGVHKPGTLDPNMDAALNPAKISAPPGTNESLTGNGNTNGLGSTGLPNDLKLANPPGTSPLSPPVGVPLQSSGPDTTDRSGGGMPMMPPMGGGQGSQNANNERPDASGLLKSSLTPWLESAPPGAVNEPGSELGTPEGGLGLKDATGKVPGVPVEPSPLTESIPPTGSELPGESSLTGSGPGSGEGGMPMMPPGSGAGSQNSNNERPDASGLLREATTPWLESSPPGSVDEPGSELGAPSGGLGLSAVPNESGPIGESELPEGSLTGSGPGSGEGGMPMMPPGSGAGSGAGSQNPNNERSDSSGLLGGVQEPWSGDETEAVAGEAGSADGTVAGGVGLTGSVPGFSSESERERERDKAKEKAAAAVPAPDVVPVLSPPAATGPEDHSAWEVGASAASALLGLSGLLRTSDPDDHEINARIVSSETDAWIDDEPPVPPSDDEPAMATWRRTAGAAPVTAIGDPDLRSGRFPPGYEPPVPSEHEEELAEDGEEESEEEPGTVAAKLLTQDSSTWGRRADDLSALE